MKTYQHTIHLEDLISRIPGLFPSMGYNEDGSLTEVQTADKFPYGCWGNIVPDLEIKEGEYISYRTLMSLYYGGEDVVKEYNSEWSWEEDIKPFVETGIGKKYFKDYSLFNKNESKYEKYMEKHHKTPSMIYMAMVDTMLKDYTYYHNLCVCYKNNEYGPESEQELCCICEEYDLRGGDDFWKWLQELSEEKLPEFKYDEKNNANSVITIKLTNSINDLGIFDAYVNRWVAGNRYLEGEIVTYKDPETMIDDSYICINPDGSEGYYDEDREITIFPIKGNIPKDKTICFEKINDSNRLITDKYEDGNNIYDGFENQLTTWKTDINSENWKDEDNKKLKLYTISNLKAVRRNKSFINSHQQVETPAKGEDWLFYYVEGQVNNVQKMQDELGNICVFETREETVKEEETHLYAYGDTLDEIKIDSTSNTITFTYTIGAHLTATLVKIDTDINGNELYYYDKFKHDKNDKYHGITYTETRNFTPDDEWYDIINNQNGELKSYQKGIFFESSIRDTIVMEDSENIVKYVAELAEYNFINSNKPDELHMPLMRNETLLGIAYPQNFDINIYINRGNAAAFERHIKLGEVKTMEDLENYANGSFFNMQNLD